MIEYITANNIEHPAICVAFTPDEEIGMGTEHFDVERFGADYAYTVDGDSSLSLTSTAIWMRLSKNVCFL